MPSRGSRHHARIPARQWRRIRRAVFERDGGACWFCQLPAIFRVVHHVVHLEHGGAPLDLDNLVTACGPCHRTHHRNESPERADWRRYLDSIL